MSVESDLALGNDRLFMSMDKLDRIDECLRSLNTPASDRRGAGGSEKVRVHAFRLGLFASDEAARYQIRQRHVHRLHAVLLAHLHGAGNLVNLTFADQISDSGGSRHDLERRHPSA